MNGEGFLSASKSFMTYDKRNLWGKIKFWAYYPIAYIKYVLEV